MDEKTKLSPAYNFKQNEPTELKSGAEATLLIEGKPFHGSYKIYLMPNTMLHLNCEFLGISPIEAFKVFQPSNSDDIQLRIQGKVIKGWQIHIDNTDEEILRLVWISSGSRLNINVANAYQIENGKFHLFNLIPIIGQKSIRDKDGILVRNREVIILENDDWEIEIVSAVIKNRTYLNLIEPILHTHTGTVRHKKGYFSDDQFIEEMNCLKYALSFAVGSWTEPSFLVGYDHAEAPTWEAYWSPYEHKRMRGRWFNSIYASDLNEFYRLFSNKFVDEKWRPVLRSVIYWYLQANDNNVNIDTGILLIQAALERLSFEYLVSHNNGLSTTKFKSNNAYDNIKLLLEKLEIPIVMPVEMTNAINFISSLKNHNFVDDNIVKLITKVRNNLIHPKNKYSGQMSSVCYEAWLCGQWCLELTLLAIIGYKGKYINRTESNGYTNYVLVPWV